MFILYVKGAPRLSGEGQAESQSRFSFIGVRQSLILSYGAATKVATPVAMTI